MATLTKKQKDDYIKSGYLECPFCKSGNISGGQIDVDAGSAFQTVGCNDCEKEWHDIYELVDVEAK